MATNQTTVTTKAGNAVATTTTRVNDSLPAIPCPDPAGYKYVGARYVPLFAEPIQWDETKQTTYEPLTIVLYQGNSYTSKQYVPVGIDITNEEFWAETGNYNAQLEQYKQLVEKLESQVNTNTDDIKWLTNLKFNVKDYGAKGDGVTNDSPAFTAAINALITAVGNENIFSPYQGICGAELYIPAGKYILNNSVIIPSIAKTTPSDDKLTWSGIKIKGDNRSNTYIEFTNNTLNGFICSGRTIKFEDINIKGGLNTIFFNEVCAYSSIYNCFIGGAENAGIYLGQYNFNIHFENILIGECNYAVYHNGGTSTQLLNVYSQDCENGFYFNNLIYSTLYNCSCDSIITKNTIAYEFNNSNVTLVNCGAEEVHNTIKGNNSVITVNGLNASGGVHIIGDLENTTLNLTGLSVRGLSTSSYTAFVGNGNVFIDKPISNYNIAPINSLLNINEDYTLVKEIPCQSEAVTLCRLGNIFTGQRYGAGKVKIWVTMKNKTADAMCSYYEVYTALDNPRVVNVTKIEPTKKEVAAPTFDIAIDYSGYISLTNTSQPDENESFIVKIKSDSFQIIDYNS